ncbi:hypothetical protein AA313_de0201678 [Arthrobotrys entomopaga]|nr:hypothetical protein AA313_de0201678 [Arthrobotrys entomopaga]
MAGLARTNCIQIFNNKVFIKGFSTLLVPTKKDGDTIFWHLLYNKDGDRISYMESATLHYAEEINISEYEASRHILGWCSNARYYAGAVDADYDGIKESGLPKPRGDDYALGKTYIQGRQTIRGGAPFSLGNKDTPFHISRENPIRRLQWIDKKFFVFWDEEDKRGWLVNGSSALLHLLRKSLTDNSHITDKFHFEFCFKKESMQEAPITHKISSAIRVLRNDSNLKQKIYPTPGGYFCVEDRLDELFDVLEKIIDHQIIVTRHKYSKADGQPETSTSSTHRRQECLEGWDFNELALCEDPIYPRLAQFQKASGGWIDFIRSINAVSFFGRGFGDMIQPEDSSCAQWAGLPKQKYYLAVAVEDLKQIMKKYGDQYASPMRLADEITWHTPGALFEECKCTKKRKHTGKHSDFVQVPLPSKLCDTLSNKNKVQLSDGGAVIFGFSKKLKGTLKDFEDLEDYDLQQSSEERDSQSRDSGIGPSLSSSLTSSFSSEDYKVGIVCALPKELLAVRALFEPKYECPTPSRGDINHYALGHLQPYNVVAACLPAGEYGTTAAASVYSHMIRSFPQIQLCLLVGIGGGVPSKNIRLGDVVVSHPIQNYPGVIQYDLGKALDNNEFEMSGSLQRPPQFIMSAISNLTSDPDIPRHPLRPYLQEITQKRSEYRYPGCEYDPLFTAPSIDEGDLACNDSTAQRPLNPRIHPKIHYGLIASGNQVMKNAQLRDRLSAKLNVLCFEMEAAGVMNAGNCLVIRGICDYADSGKNDTWQEYAAATAASYAKLLLSKTIIPIDATELQVDSLVATRSRKRRQSLESLNSVPLKKLRRARHDKR